MRYTVFNTADEFYVKEIEYYDEGGAKIHNYIFGSAVALLETPFRVELEERAFTSPLFKRYRG